MTAMDDAERMRERHDPRAQPGALRRARGVGGAALRHHPRADRRLGRAGLGRPGRSDAAIAAAPALRHHRADPGRGRRRDDRADLCLGAALSDLLRRHRVRRHDPASADAAPDEISGALVTVSFDAQTAPGLDWEFRPLTAAGHGPSGRADPSLLSRRKPQRKARDRARGLQRHAQQDRDLFRQAAMLLLQQPDPAARARASIWVSCFLSTRTC